MRSFAKGFFAGSLIGSAVGIMVEPSAAYKMKRLRKKTNKAIKNMGCAIEDFINRN